MSKSKKESKGKSKSEPLDRETFIEEYYKKRKKDTFEYTMNQVVEFDFPEPIKRYYMIYESFSASIEETYFWVMNYFMYDMGMPEIVKISDLFGASEHSTFFNVAQQRIGLNQDKVAQYLGSIGKMVKDMFQIVRELRILDERWEIYYKSKKSEGIKYKQNEQEEKWEEERSDEAEDNNEITLKGIYVDLAEGGSKNPGSVFGMAQQLQYTTLPDLFFTIHAGSDKEITQKVDNLEFNKNVKWVLKRKLSAYIKWKKHTFHEIRNRRMFTLKYLRQHYMVIKTYIAWVKPYLRNISRLRNDPSKSDSADLVAAFESSLLELEFIGKFLPKGNKDVFTCISTHFIYRTMPQMNYQAEGYQRAPLHVGEIKWNMRGYTWTNKDIEEYKRMREAEDLQMMVEIESSLKDAMDALGGDVEKYIEEAGGYVNKPVKKDDEDSKKKDADELPNLFEPFNALFDAFAEPFKGIFKEHKISETKAEKQKEIRLKKEAGAAKGQLAFRMWLTYKNFKKSHRMIVW